MDRRAFLKHSAIWTVGLGIGPALSRLASPLLAAPRANGHFVLNLLTDQPELAADRVVEILKSARLPLGKVKFRQATLSGRHVGDVALIRNHELVDYRTAGDGLSRRVLELAQRLELPRVVEHPRWLKFWSEADAPQAQRVNVFHRNVLVDQFEIRQHLDAVQVRGSQGGVTLKIEKGQVRVLSASCKHQTCVKLGPISRPGENLVCIPNELRIEIEGAGPSEVDSRAF